MSLTNSLRKVFFLTNLDKNQKKEISKIKIPLSLIKRKNKNKSNNSEEFSIYDKRHYKLNHDLNFYPNIETPQKNKFKPIIFKTGTIHQNQKKIKQNSQFYIPIMKQLAIIDPIQSLFLEDTINTSRTKNELSYSHRKLKIQENLIKDKDKNINKSENESKKQNEISTVVSYSFDKNGRARLKRSCLNLDNYKNNIERQTIEDLLEKIERKKREY